MKRGKMKNISKEIFLNTLACPSLGWLLRSEDDIAQLSYESLSLGEQFRMEQGIEIGRRARGLYPDGYLISRRNLTTTAEETEALMRKSDTSVIFEATFLVDDYAAKADILIKEGKGWHLIEVKSDTNDKPELLDDLAYTLMVISRVGYKISKASLLLISKDYRLGMEDRELFVEVDHTPDGLLRSIQFDTFWDLAKEQTAAASMPEPELLLECKKCQLLFDCMAKDIENHILEIPRLSQKKFDGLKELGIVRIEDIPPTFELTSNQARVRNCVVTGEPWISEELGIALDVIKYPAFYLDFETVQTAIPLYPDIAPYTQIPTQYSIHKCEDVGKVIKHQDFICDHRKDSRRELAENLIRDLENEGSIISYSGFEKTTINNLANLYSDHSDRLNALADRIIDLQDVIRQNFYHPVFHGSISIKVTLPVLVPEMSYDDLAISEGDSASAAFAYLALGKYTGETEVETVKRNLLQYCKQDTLAMVKLHEKLCEYI